MAELTGCHRPRAAGLPANAPPGTEIQYTEFPRLLPAYKDLINEMIFRLR